MVRVKTEAKIYQGLNGSPMPNHLTVRMAWHDNNWNGMVCKDPEANVYCVGNHSLLSERIARERQTKLEQANAGKRIDKLPEGYLPPCYYTTNAFSNLSLEIQHKHAFRGAKADVIPDVLPSFSVFTWPFRLSFNHSKKKKQQEGEYPPDLEKRIARFRSRFLPDESFVFFYLNYDNPISADDVSTAQGYYVLVGCALIKEVREAKHFNLDSVWETKLRNRNWPKYKNFPTMNWAFPILYDFEKTGVLLPYKEYLERARKFPEEQPKLERMRVLIEEDGLLPHFKYVATYMNDDAAIYLLYKLRKALRITQEDGVVDTTLQLERIEGLLRKAWKRRSLYPSLSRVLDVIYDPQDKDTYIKNQTLVEEIRENLRDQEDLAERVFELVGSSRPIPGYLSNHKAWIAALRKNLKDLSDETELLKKLTLFDLTHNQIDRILNNREDAFNRNISGEEIARNPYLLAEEYVPEEFKGGEDKDQEELPDGEIDLFTIDVGMHPDPKYVTDESGLQDLTPASAERIRALAIEYLKSRGSQGDCFVNLKDLYEFIAEYPIFYKSTLNIPQSKLATLQGSFRDHFEERIFVDNESKTGPYFYLREVKEAEKIVAKTVDELLKQEDYDFGVSGIQEFNEREAASLATIPEFDKTKFMGERNALLSAVFDRHFYIISGKPGSGKTKALGKIVSELLKKNELVTLLAPTGKASLRLREEVEGSKGADPKTIDRFVYATDFKKCLKSFENLLSLKGEKRLVIQNLIIDESSMVDLQRLAILFEMLWKDSSHKQLSVTRVILVGDENQLPPIGFGRPFYDIIQRIRDDKRYRNGNYIQLRTNCRAHFDPNIMRLAEIYESKNRYYEEKLRQLVSGGKISKGLTVLLWKSNAELRTLIQNRLDRLLPLSTKGTNLSTEDRTKGLYMLLGLYDKGYVKWNKEKNNWSIDLDNFQILSPYRGEGFGTLGLNEQVKSAYNPSPITDYGAFKRFDHGDKMIRLDNWYSWDKSIGGTTLRLSNGSIGVACDNKQPKGRQYYFPETGPIKKIDDADNFEHAYAITVHKAQGSEFNDVFFVLPRKKSLLTKELIYTALTRSKRSLFLFLQESLEKSPLEDALGRSAILPRNTSLFEPPEDVKYKFWPSKDVPVKSKIEYILYKYLVEAQASGVLKFSYESELYLASKGLTIHPDFTIKIGNRTYFWEHLGELDLGQYSQDWKNRRQDYLANGLLDQLITTDDLGGVRDELIQPVISDLVKGKLRDTEGGFSKHHYQLYL